DRALDPRRGEGVVADRDDLVLARNVGDRGEINDLEHRIGRALDPDHSGVGAYCFFKRGWIGKVHKRSLQTRRALAHALEDPVAAAVQIVHRHHVRAGIEQLEHGADRRHAGSEGEAAVAAFQLGEAGLEGVARRVARARVVEALVLARAGLRVGRGGVNRRHHRAGARVGRLPGVDHLGLELHCWVLLLSQFRTSMRVISPRNSSPSTTIATMPRLKMSISCPTGASGATVTMWLSIAAVTGSRKCAGLSMTSIRISCSSTIPTTLPFFSSTGSCDTS